VPLKGAGGRSSSLGLFGCLQRESTLRCSDIPQVRERNFEDRTGRDTKDGGIRSCEGKGEVRITRGYLSVTERGENSMKGERRRSRLYPNEENVSGRCKKRRGNRTRTSMGGGVSFRVRFT